MIEEKTKFYTCKYDRTFKEVFLNPNNKDILKCILEKILKTKIKEIKVKPTELIEGNINVKRKRVDALLYTDEGITEIEVNSNMEEYVHPRNTSYICNIYQRHILARTNYDEKTKIVQINFTYGLKDKKAYRVYKLMDEEGKLFVKNLIIYEVNMEYYMKMWYDKDEKGIEENKHIIMLNLNNEELEKMPKDEIVEKYAMNIKIVNGNPEFQEYMSEEEDRRKIYNSIKSEAMEKGLKQGIEKGIKDGIKEGIKQGIEQGIEQGSRNNKIEVAKSMLKETSDLEFISRITTLSIEEIKELME